MHISYNNSFFKVDTDILKDKDLDSIYDTVSGIINMETHSFDIIFEDKILEENDSKKFNSYDVFYIIWKPLKLIKLLYEKLTYNISISNAKEVKRIFDLNILKISSKFGIMLLNIAKDTKSITIIDLVLSKVIGKLSNKYIQIELINLYKLTMNE